MKCYDIWNNQIFICFVSRSPIGTPVFHVTAYYTTYENRIYLYSGLLQPPLYYQNASLASKYGALGWIISHEIMHAIGIKGSFNQYIHFSVS